MECLKHPYFTSVMEVEINEEIGVNDIPAQMSEGFEKTVNSASINNSNQSVL